MLYLDTPARVARPIRTAPRRFPWKLAAHLIADTTEELVAYAASLGVLAHWIQKPGTAEEHFDLTGAPLRDALADPVVRKLTRVQMAAMLKRKRTAVAAKKQPGGPA